MKWHSNSLEEVIGGAASTDTLFTMDVVGEQALKRVQNNCGRVSMSVHN